MSALSRSIIAGAASALLFLSPTAAEGPSFAVRAKRIVPVSAEGPQVIEDGVMVIINGRISAIGPAKTVEIPPDLRLIEFPDETIIPGFVAAQSDLAGAHRGNESISGSYHAADAFDRFGDYRAILASGVTTVHLNPGWHRLASGRGAIVKLGGRHDRRLLNDGADLTINLGAPAFNPPNLVELLVPPTGDQPIQPEEVQRPSSRIDQYLALTEAIESAQNQDGFNLHLASFRAAWRGSTPVRIQTNRAADIVGALAFLKEHERSGYLVGGIEATDIADTLRESGVPLVYTIDTSLRSTGSNLGNDPDALSGHVEELGALAGIKLALATARGIPLTDLRLAGATALRAGLGEEAVLRALTRTPAEILGIADRVGSLEPGRDADFLVMTGPPLATSSHVARAYVEGNLVYKREREDSGGGSVLIRGGTIWLGPGEWIEGGAVLIEDGRITAVGRSVPHPPDAKVVDAGPDAFVTPGFVDAHGHLGLSGDRSATAPELTLARIVGAPDLASRRVARSGVTTVMLAPYAFHGNGSQVAAVKTAGRDREHRVVAATAAVAFNMRGVDPKAIPGRLNGRITAGKKYLEKWQKYEKDLEEWRKKKESGELDESAQPKTEEVVTEESSEDPITGTWSVRVTGGPIPEDVEATIALTLKGTAVEGRVLDPLPPVELKITGTFDGSTITGVIDVDTEGMGKPQFEANLVEPDHLTGSITLQQFAVDFDANRTDKEAVEFKVTRRRRTTGKDGRPLPPPIDESLEPMRLLLEKKIPALVHAASAQEIDAVLDVLVDKHELNVIILGGNDARRLVDRLREKNVGVIVPTGIVRREDNVPYHQADDLSRSGLDVAFQSDSEDGARLLPLVGLHAVERGMSAEEALAALTIDPARMYQIDDRVGSLTPGCDGDVVIFSGHPFEASSRVMRVFINGKEVSKE